MSIDHQKHVPTTFAVNDLSYRFSWFHLARPLTLTGTINPIITGTIIASMQGKVYYDIFITFLIASMLIQISANMLNDYFDLKNGQDYEKWIKNSNRSFTKLPMHQEIPYVVSVMIMLAIILGIWLSIRINWWVALVGLVGIIMSFAYSAGKKSLSALGLGEIVAAVYLGFVPTILAYIMHDNFINFKIILLASPFSLLIASMILSNNIRDIKKDTGFRRTLAIRMGRKNAFYLLNALLLFAYTIIFILVISQTISWTVSVVFFAMPFAYKLLNSYKINAKRMDEINGMKWAARHHWAFGTLFWLGLLLGS